METKLIFDLVMVMDIFYIRYLIVSVTVTELRKMEPLGGILNHTGYNVINTKVTLSDCLSVRQLLLKLLSLKKFFMV